MDDDIRRAFIQSRELCADTVRSCEVSRSRIESAARQLQPSVERLQHSAACLEDAFKRLAGPGR